MKSHAVTVAWERNSIPRGLDFCGLQFGRDETYFRERPFSIPACESSARGEQRAPLSVRAIARTESGRLPGRPANRRIRGNSHLFLLNNVKYCYLNGGSKLYDASPAFTKGKGRSRSLKVASGSAKYEPQRVPSDHGRQIHFEWSGNANQRLGEGRRGGQESRLIRPNRTFYTP